jgi:hypothetical protein
MINVNSNHNFHQNFMRRPSDGAAFSPISTHRVNQKFTPEEDEVIISMVESGRAKQWRSIADRLDGRNARQCGERLVNYLNPSVTKSVWALSEEALLRQKVMELGPQWSLITRFFDGRTDSPLKNRSLRLMRRDRMAARKAQRAISSHTAIPQDFTPISDDEGDTLSMDAGADCCDDR